MPGKINLKVRLLWRGGFGVLSVGALLFISARSTRFWQAWAYLAVSTVATGCMTLYFYKRDRALLQRRMLTREKVIVQRVAIGIWRFLAAVSLALAGDDHRFGWSRALFAPVPLWLECLSLVFISGGYVILFWVMRTNSFAASIIQVEAEQSVIASGPYRIVRHPMYVGFGMIGLFTPPALGSFIAWPAAALIIPVIAIRLLNEEKMLRRDLPGYSEYCAQTPFRLIPHVW